MVKEYYVISGNVRYVYKAKNYREAVVKFFLDVRNNLINSNYVRQVIFVHDKNETIEKAIVLRTAPVLYKLGFLTWDEYRENIDLIGLGNVSVKEMEDWANEDYKSLFE